MGMTSPLRPIPVVLTILTQFLRPQINQRRTTARLGKSSSHYLKLSHRHSHHNSATFQRSTPRFMKSQSQPHLAIPQSKLRRFLLCPWTQFQVRNRSLLPLHCLPVRKGLNSFVVVVPATVDPNPPHPIDSSPPKQSGSDDDEEDYKELLDSLSAGTLGGGDDVEDEWDTGTSDLPRVPLDIDARLNLKNLKGL